MEKNNVLNRLKEKMDKDPWYIKLKRRIRLKTYFLYLNILHKLKGMDLFKSPMDYLAYEIKQDIEFGYDSKRIYGKLVSGAYGNTPKKGKNNEYEKFNLSQDKLNEAILLLRRFHKAYGQTFYTNSRSMTIPMNFATLSVAIDEYLKDIDNHEDTKKKSKK